MLTENLKSHFSFNGSVPRSQYWVTMLIIFIVVTIVPSLFNVIDRLPVLLITNTVIVTIVWVTLAVTAKRCRNCGLNPWWTAATLIPIIGLVVTETTESFTLIFIGDILSTLNLPIIIVLGCLSTKDSEG
jgi:uncharacterized membrane protein YhaH (DUF805 family)